MVLGVHCVSSSMIRPVSPMMLYTWMSGLLALHVQRELGGNIIMTPEDGSACFVLCGVRATGGSIAQMS